MHVLLRPAEGRVNARLRDGLPDAVDSIRGAERTERAREESRSGIEGARVWRCAALQSDGNERWRDSFDVGDFRRAGGVQLAAGAGGPDFVFEERVDIGV